MSTRSKLYNYQTKFAVIALKWVEKKAWGFPTLDVYSNLLSTCITIKYRVQIYNESVNIALTLLTVIVIKHFFCDC